MIIQAAPSLMKSKVHFQFNACRHHHLSLMLLLKFRTFIMKNTMIWNRKKSFTIAMSDFQFQNAKKKNIFPMHYQNFLKILLNKIVYHTTARRWNKTSPRRGIEPRSPAWQAGILTTILTRMLDINNSRTIINLLYYKLVAKWLKWVQAPLGTSSKSW